MQKFNPDKAKGILLGMAAGDRIGGSIQMALKLTEFLAETGRFDKALIAERYFEWWSKEGYDAGPVSDKVFKYVKSGLSFEEALEAADRYFEGYTAGCNPSHRSVPLAIAQFIPDEEISSCAILEAEITHKHHLAGDSAAAVVVMLRELIKGAGLIEALEKAKQGRDDITKNALQLKPLDKINTDGFSPSVLSASLYFITENDNFNSMLKAAMEFSGPSNYCPVLAGSIGGALWGASSINPFWFSGKEIYSQLTEAVEKILG